MGVDRILHYFPRLSSDQIDRLTRMGPCYLEWNAQINVISRKDAENLFEKHILHSLAIAKVLQFRPGTKILDIGTGGGFPGIPLAVLFPETNFLLVDSIGKKIKVVQGVAEALGLDNVRSQHVRAESVQETFDFVISRAVTSFDKFLPWTRGKFKTEMINSFPNGIFYLKGGDLSDELKHLRGMDSDVFPVSDWFEEEFFTTKKLVYVRMVD